MKNKTTLRETRNIAWLLLIIFTWSVFEPAIVFAGGGGPTQPETNSFTPIGVSDMVDPFTGDFTYNIPLMDVDGYPINIAYNSGVSMDQEASWVGLGWNLNTGAITRALRGLPDDFNGEEVKTEHNVKPMINMALDAGIKVEIAGFNLSKNSSGGGGLKLSAGLGFNNYHGFSSSISIGPSFDLGKFMGANATAGFSLSGSSENGASFAPSVSLSRDKETKDKAILSKTSTIGSAFNSRSGLQAITYSMTASRQKYKTVGRTDANGNAVMGEDGNQIQDVVKNGKHGGDAGGSYDFGLNEYFPTSQHSMWGASLAFNLNVTGSFFFTDGQGNIGVRFSKNWIPEDLKTQYTKSYGYLFSENGQSNEKGQLDFNRDNDQAFSKYSVNLPSTFQTYDIFSVSAQGVGGSFRPIRNDVGYVTDPSTFCLDIGGQGGLELGFGNLSDVGVDIQVPITSTRSGRWEDGNAALNKLRFRSGGVNRIVGSYSFVEANERSVLQDEFMNNQFLGDQPERIELGGSAIFPQLRGSLNQGSQMKNISTNASQKRELTNNQFYFLNRKEVADGMGLFEPNTGAYNPNRDYHIAEITQLGTDGRRYVFGIPVYNKLQEDVSFATGKGMYGGGGIPYSENYSGLIDCGSSFSTHASKNNKEGIDHFYNSTTIPPYAHSYMLSAVLSDDYIDSELPKGPSDGDMGSYVKFDYEVVSDHKWRTPMTNKPNSAYYSEGLKTNKSDDKASFTYGVKDLHYVKKIETKNYIVLFDFKPERKDGRAALGREGGISGSDVGAMKALHSITMYVKSEYINNPNAVPVQQVVFRYDESLCRRYPGNHEYNSSDPTKGGKLTLLEITFTYQNSKKMKFRSYKFDYHQDNPEENPTFALKGTDRWGTYKPVPASSGEDGMSSPLSNSDFPYTDQNPALTDVYAKAWNLKTIHLPSGGSIEVDYESDDYAYVQHLKASQMFKIVGVYNPQNNTYDESGFDGDVNEQYISNDTDKNMHLIFKLQNQTDKITNYALDGEQIYFRALVVLDPAGSTLKERAEYISGYATINEIKKVEINGVFYGVISLNGEKLKDGDNPPPYNPITKQAILFGRAQLSRTISSSPDLQLPSSDPEGEQVVSDLANSMVDAIASFKELVSGPNKRIYDMEKGQKLVVNKSWIRLKSPNGRKLGGGSRVKSIKINDNWKAEMGGSYDSSYGQTFKYVLEDGKTSSGVASYEPQLGGDENSWHTAYAKTIEKPLAMDDKMYIENPIMESQFPNPSVGYSRVVIEDFKYENVTRHATGKVVKEFYTAKDFPTIVKATHLDILPKNKLLPIGPKFQYLTANQGFSIELNDMHGKPKKESVYAEGATNPLSMVEYIYQKENLYLNGQESSRLKNQVKVINPDGTISERTIGVRYDAVADFRESKTVSNTTKMSINTNSMLISAFFIAVPPIFPGFDRTTNRFRSATLNKTIQKFGVLEKTIANQDGSIVETNNLAYDSKTGEVLVSQTTTNFNDKIYSLNYPAYWKYDALGQASQNIMYTYRASAITNGFVNVPMSLNHFKEGDEVSVKSGSSVTRAWVVIRNDSGIKLVDKSGAPIAGGAADIKIIRSGYRNKQSTSMASMTALNNPLDGIGNNQFTNVLNAGAVEFGQDWRTYCNCFPDGTGSTNPYVQGIKGNWRPIRSFTHLSGRTQSNFDNNTNIRKDGVFTSYTPFYKVTQGQWDKDQQNWTFVSEVTEFSTNGMTLETRDALGRYSSSLFGFNHTKTAAVAANSKLQQITTGSFEDYKYTNCSEEGYFSKAKVGTGQVEALQPSSISTQHSHTGKNSLRVEAGTPVVFENVITTCTEGDVCDMIIPHIEVEAGQLLIAQGTMPYHIEVIPEVGEGSAFMYAANEIHYSLNTDSELNLLLINVIDAKGCKIRFGIEVINGMAVPHIYGN